MPGRHVFDCLSLADQCEREAGRARDPEANRFFHQLAIRFLRAAETFDYLPSKTKPPKESTNRNPAVGG
jgi:hypothetical protein